LMFRPLLFNWLVAPMLLLMMMRWRDLYRSKCCSVHLALAASQGSAVWNGGENSIV
jgi:hypothetical protein